MQETKIRTARFAKIDDNDTKDTSNEADSSKSGNIVIIQT